MHDQREQYRQFLFRPTSALAALFILVLSGSTISRNAIWQDEEHFHADAIRKSPGKARVYYNAGVYYHDIDDLDRAEEYYLKSTQLNMEYRDVHGGALYNLGVIYAKQGKIDRSIEAFSGAIDIDPGDAAAYYKRGILLHIIGQADLAREDIERARQLDPDVDRIP
jgi:tetratricopeptide (TPR) repeat protein